MKFDIKASYVQLCDFVVRRDRGSDCAYDCFCIYLCMVSDHNARNVNGINIESFCLDLKFGCEFLYIDIGSFEVLEVPTTTISRMIVVDNGCYMLCSSGWVLVDPKSLYFYDDIVKFIGEI